MIEPKDVELGTPGRQPCPIPIHMLAWVYQLSFGDDTLANVMPDKLTLDG